jgi:flavin reductase (DIM6/NTAB) family NADH-FMN oxidoreductase RutF
LKRQVSWVTEELWAPVTAVSAEHEGRASGLICSTAVSASLDPEHARVVLQLRKDNLTHELALASGRFALHLLRRDQHELFRFLALDTGAPYEETLATAECRIVATLDAGDATVVLADVVHEARRAGEPFTEADIVWDDALRGA